MATILTYDIPTKHPEFKKLMFKLGYSESFNDANGKKVNLPNTTLYHPTRSTGEAIEDAKSSSKQLEIKLERAVSSIFLGWNAIFGEEYK